MREVLNRYCGYMSVPIYLEDLGQEKPAKDPEEPTGTEEEEKAKTCIGIVPAYRGGDITDTRHEFTKEEFFVFATFDDGSEGEVEDYELTMDGMKDGYFRLTFTYQGVSNGCLIPCKAPVYPSDYAVLEHQQNG